MMKKNKDGTLKTQFPLPGGAELNLRFHDEQGKEVDPELIARVLKLENDLAIAERKVEELEAVLDRIAVEATEATREGS